MTSRLIVTDRLNAVLDDAELNDEGTLDKWADLYGSEFVDYFDVDADEPQKFPYRRAAKNKG